MSRRVHAKTLVESAPAMGAPVPWPSRASLWSFVAVGLLPGLFAGRRLPVGLWHMVWGWAWIIAAILLVTLLATFSRPRTRHVLQTVVLTLAIAVRCPL